MQPLCISPVKEKPVCLSPRQFQDLLADMALEEKLGHTAVYKKEAITKESHGQMFEGMAWEFVMLKDARGRTCERKRIRVEWIKTPCVYAKNVQGRMVYEIIPGKDKIEIESFIWQEDSFVQIQQHAALRQHA